MSLGGKSGQPEGQASVPTGTDHTAASNPLTQKIGAWLEIVSRARRGLRLYPKNNPTLAQYLDAAHAELTELLRRDAELSLNVLEDRLLYKGEVVLIDPDRQDGLPFLFYAAGILRIDFVQGITHEEVVHFLDAICLDFSNAVYAGEDLITLLWRLNLRHVRHMGVDLIEQGYLRGGGGRGGQGAGEYERIALQVRSELSTISQGFEHAFESPEQLHQLGMAEAAPIDFSRALRNSQLSEDRLYEFAQELQIKDSHDELSARLTDLLIDAMRSDVQGALTSPALATFVQLFDASIQAYAYEDAIKLINRLMQIRANSARPEERDLLERLLARFGSRAYVAHAVAGMNDKSAAISLLRVMEFFRALGPFVLDSVFELVDTIEVSEARNFTCEFLVSEGASQPAKLVQKMQNSRWEVAKSFLILGRGLPHDVFSALIWLGLEHEHPHVRAKAIANLRFFQARETDPLARGALLDEHPQVRVNALKLLGHRPSQENRMALEEYIKQAPLDQLAVHEIQAMFSSYAHVTGQSGIPLLKEILLHEGSFKRKKMRPEADTEAALALIDVGSKEALALVEAAGKSGVKRTRSGTKESSFTDLDREDDEGEFFSGSYRSAPMLVSLGQLPPLGPRPNVAPTKRSSVPPPLRKTATSKIAAQKSRVSLLPAKSLSDLGASSPKARTGKERISVIESPTDESLDAMIREFADKDSVSRTSEDDDSDPKPT